MGPHISITDLMKLYLSHWFIKIKIETKWLRNTAHIFTVLIKQDMNYVASGGQMNVSAHLKSLLWATLSYEYWAAPWGVLLDFSYFVKSVTRMLV